MKPILFSFLFAALCWLPLQSAEVSAQPAGHRLSSHILDIHTGQPAQGVVIELYKLSAQQGWEAVAQRTTDANGRVKDFLPEDQPNYKGIYKLCFRVAPYFAAQQIETFYPFIEVVFEINDDTHYHVPIVLSPFGYSTYRGN